MSKPMTIGALCVLLAAVSGPARAADEHLVMAISDYDNFRMYFTPKLLLIKPGDTVTWVNKDSEEHNVVTYPDGFPKGASPVHSPYIRKKGEMWSFTFKRPGTYEYHCVPHLKLGMHGTIIVGRPSTDAEFHVPSKEDITAYRKQVERVYGDED